MALITYDFIGLAVVLVQQVTTLHFKVCSLTTCSLVRYKVVCILSSTCAPKNGDFPISTLIVPSPWRFGNPFLRISA